ncbi:hypothetical protein BAE44_0002120 [Dichanthelium oligosanthes]|uniref:C2H2-type domain-containing protein n=1 Tax=Dichanthelium oligosanthes TaxID=888268 RepID=A0A1E5WHM7_9POAL|nr:hypothetical protein BAE44_0002120 [Dichanthelium oligosanthes]
MAGGSSEDRWRRPSHCNGDLRDDEPEEGEFVPGDHSDMDTEEYYNRHCPLSNSDETVSDSNAACSVVPASYGEVTSAPSVVTANNNNGGNASSSSVAAPAPAALACPVCGKAPFRSLKAVCGHMKVHKGHRGVAVVGVWGGTGKQGCSGLGARAATPNAESDQSMAIVVAEPMIVLQPMPLAFATPNLSSSVSMASATPNLSSVPVASATPNLSPVPVASTITDVSGQSSSAQPMPNDDVMDTVVAGGANPPSEAVVHLHAAPPPAAGEQAPSIHQQLPMAPPPAVERAPPVHQPPIAPRPATSRQNPNGYTCKQCNMWFQTHQGLGGHKAGHSNKEAAAAAAGMLEDGAAPCHRNAKPAKAHVCKVCGEVFTAGVQLGGHMRKHYTGPPIVPNKKPRLAIAIEPHLPPPALTLALSVNAVEASPAPAVEAAPQPGPAPAVERAPEPAPRPAAAGRVLLFGIDIGMAAQKPAAQEGPSATEGSAASTGGEQ